MNVVTIQCIECGATKHIYYSDAPIDLCGWRCDYIRSDGEVGWGCPFCAESSSHVVRMPNGDFK